MAGKHLSPCGSESRRFIQGPPAASEDWGLMRRSTSFPARFCDSVSLRIEDGPLERLGAHAGGRVSPPGLGRLGGQGGCWGGPGGRQGLEAPDLREEAGFYYEKWVLGRLDKVQHRKCQHKQ